MDCRLATTEDIPELVSLMESLGYDTNEVELQNVMEEIRQTRGEVFVAVWSGKVVGCINAILDVRLAEGRTGEIASLVVSSSFRGKGVGRALLECAESWLTQRAGKIRIRANDQRVDAHGFYKSSGYTEWKQQKIFLKSI